MCALKWQFQSSPNTSWRKFLSLLDRVFFSFSHVSTTRRFFRRERNDVAFVMISEHSFYFPFWFLQIKSRGTTWDFWSAGLRLTVKRFDLNRRLLFFPSRQESDLKLLYGFFELDVFQKTSFHFGWVSRLQVFSQKFVCEVMSQIVHRLELNILPGCSPTSGTCCFFCLWIFLKIGSRIDGIFRIVLYTAKHQGERIIERWVRGRREEIPVYSELDQGMTEGERRYLPKVRLNSERLWKGGDTPFNAR